MTTERSDIGTESIHRRHIVMNAFILALTVTLAHHFFLLPLTAQTTLILTSGEYKLGTMTFPIWPYCTAATPDGGYLICYAADPFRTQERSDLAFCISKVGPDRSISWSYAYDLGAGMRRMEPFMIRMNDDGTFGLIIQRNRGLGHNIDIEPWDIGYLLIDHEGIVISNGHYRSLDRTRDSAVADRLPWDIEEMVDVASLDNGYLLLKQARRGFSLVWLDEQGYWKRSVAYDAGDVIDISAQSRDSLGGLHAIAVTIGRTGKIIVVAEFEAGRSDKSYGAVFIIDREGQPIRSKGIRTPTVPHLYDIITLSDGRIVITGSSHRVDFDVERVLGTSQTTSDFVDTEMLEYRFLRDSSMSDATYWILDEDLAAAKKSRLQGRRWDSRLIRSERLPTGEIMILESSRIEGRIARLHQADDSDGYVILSEAGEITARHSLGRLSNMEFDTLDLIVHGDGIISETPVVPPRGRIRVRGVSPGIDGTFLFRGEDQAGSIVYMMKTLEGQSPCLTPDTITIDRVLEDVETFDLPITTTPFHLEGSRDTFLVSRIALTSPFVPVCEQPLTTDRDPR